MRTEISEADWREFKRVRERLLERHCRQTLDGLLDEIGSPNVDAVERYQRAYKWIVKRDKEMARLFDDFRRSSVVLQLGCMRQAGLLTEEDLTGFSDEVREAAAWVDRL